ncbi:MAG: PKD domain-containing protein, partial [Armatimonadota bacterium]
MIRVTLLVLLSISTLGAVCAADKRMDLSLSNTRRAAAAEIARVSVPVPAGLMSKGPATSIVEGNGKRLPVQASVITRHPDGSVRRVMLSFPVRLAPGQLATFSYGPGPSGKPSVPLARTEGAATLLTTAAWTLRFTDDLLTLSSPTGVALGELRPFGPTLTQPQPPTLTVIENGPQFAWLRWRQDGADYSREVDVQADQLGRLRLTQRLLRHLTGNGWTPDFGFALAAPQAQPLRLPRQPVRFLALPVAEPLGQRLDLVPSVRLANGRQISLANPLALRQHRGSLEASEEGGNVTLRFSRIEPVAEEIQKLQHQEGMWQFMELVLQPGTPEQLAAALDSPLAVAVDWQAYDAVYHTGPPLRVKHPLLKQLVEKYVTTIQKFPALGDDLGSLGGLERYNHCQYIWEDFFRTGDQRLLRVAMEYSENYNDYSVYWGPNADYYGGGRYPATDQTRPWPGSFRTRFNNAVTFCTKGYHSFWLVYEETGDPRFRYAAEQQAEWSAKHVTAGVNYTRCIGQVIDFVRMYEYTGDRKYLAQAERLWGDLKGVQNPDLLYTEGGVLATGNDLYVPDDRFGYEHPYVKSYITQYATNALPYLLAQTPSDQRLRDTIIACNDWMAKVQTAAGGWSYPGPTTAGFGWSTEYCHGLMAGYEIARKPAYLDAVGRDLRAIASLYAMYQAIPSGVAPWEYLAGLSTDDLGKRYHLGSDRDRSKDFTDGRLNFGASPDSTVYFQVLLRDYLKYRTEASLFTPDPVLDQILALPASVAGGFPQKGDASLRISVSARQSPVGLAVSLTAASVYKLAGKPLQYRWVFADESRAEGQQVTHTFPAGGPQEVKLIAGLGKAEYLRTVVLTAPAGPGDLGLTRWPSGLRLQAEDFTAQGGGVTGVKVRGKTEKVGSDGGSISHWDPLNAWVEWTATVLTAGRYHVLLRYASPTTAERAFALDGQTVGVVKMEPTGGYSSTADDWRLELLRDEAGKPLAVEMPVGRHTLRLTNTDAKGCNLDYLEL